MQVEESVNWRVGGSGRKAVGGALPAACRTIAFRAPRLEVRIGRLTRAAGKGRDFRCWSVPSHPAASLSSA
jgi:hypothetical protein